MAKVHFYWSTLSESEKVVCKFAAVVIIFLAGAFLQSFEYQVY